MVNYYTDESPAKDESGSLVGGALNLLSQYEANSEGDEYSAKNPSNNAEGGGLDRLAKACKKSHREAIKAALKLSPIEHHALVRGADFHKGSASKTHRGDQDFTTKKGDKDYHQAGHDEAGNPYSGGALADISQSKSPSHLAQMIHKDKDLSGGDFLDDIGKVANIALPFIPHLMGGSFLDTLGKIATTVAPFAPLLL
jgi:hypothetical protein